jgi:general secretion pathway protein L
MIFDQFLAVDYGTKFIKGVLFRNVLGTLSVIRSEALPVVRFEEGEGDEYEYNMIRFIQSFFPEESKFLSNISLEKTFIRDLNIPLTSEKAIREIIPFEAENKLPFPSETMEVLGVLSKVDSEGAFVVTFCVSHEEIARVMSPFTRGDARVACLSVDSQALSTLLVPRKDEAAVQNPFQAQLDIGAEITTFNVANQGRLIHTRSFPLGSNHLTEIIAEELGISEDEAEELKLLFSPYILDGQETFPESLDLFKRKYKITQANWKLTQKKTQDFIKRMSLEIQKSLYSLLDTERPGAIYISGGGSKLIGIEGSLGNILELEIRHYEGIPLQDPSFTLAYATGLHYLRKSSEKIDFLETGFARRLNKNSFRISNFLPHLTLTGISVFILLAVFGFGILIDKRKISQNQQVLVEKYKKGFGEEPPDPESVISSAQRKLKEEQKKTEIFRLFLNRESVLDVLTELSDNFPDKESFAFNLDQFNYSSNNVEFNGYVNEFSEIGTVESALARSKKFKNIKVISKNMNSSATKFKINFKISMEVVRPDER